MTLTTIDLTPRIGTEVKADRETLLNGSEANTIRRLLEERGVLAFRSINFTDDEQLGFAKTLGTIQQKGEKGIYKVTLDPKAHETAEYLKGAFFWHFDGALDNAPALATMLSGRRLAAAGGDTEFCNTYAAHEDLPESEAKQLENLKVHHALEASQRLVYPNPTEEQLRTWRNRRPGKNHPLVWRHRSGRKSLLIGASASYVLDMPRPESDALLKQLLDWTTRPQYVYRHKWQLGDLVIWDNTGTLHKATPYDLDSGRLLHRTALEGEEMVA
jgi:alpha-ketoglutarate-dependent taurine dioxygenase